MFGKIFAQIFDGSLYGQWQALVTFQQMIVLADRCGVVDMTPEAMSARTSIPLDIITKGLVILEAPDPQSRTPDEDGRRIVRLSDNRTWGWTITNHAQYRHLRSQDDRREYMRDLMREQRANKRTAVSKPLAVVSSVSPALANVSPCRGRGSKQKKTTTTAPPADVLFEQAWKAYPRRPNNPKAKAQRAWEDRLAESVDPAAMLAGVHAYAAYVSRTDTPDRFVKMASTFFGPDRHWETDFGTAEDDMIETYDEHGEMSIAMAKAMGVVK